jgi:hypothetical protein
MKTLDEKKREGDDYSRGLDRAGEGKTGTG